MLKIDKEIKDLIKTSLFLDSARKNKLLEILEVASESEKKTILKTLRKDKKDFEKMIKNFISKKGEEGIQILDKKFLEAKSILDEHELK